MIYLTINCRESGFMENKFPICKNNLLQLHHYQYEQWARGSNRNFQHIFPKTKNTNSCLLLPYSSENAVSCFDGLRQQKISRTKTFMLDSTFKTGELQVLFMGDSRTRQHFFNFLKVSGTRNKVRGGLIWSLHESGI